ncbi:amidohydrolase family protein [Bordetella petrii]|uniref:amidohydrolase family protein n=1 Tax=Bordetella petrii TaxID=94624 RepID=UPI001A96204F|nr:amidohydrolase family protein [Bordetella petrii]MBO1114771.1 amidohydrolase family protein [Bordetella petrii]
MATFAYSSGAGKPTAGIPAHACDCHIHVYDAAWPAAPGASLRPPDASIAQYRALQQRLGTTRAVLVTPSTYGADNRGMLAGLAGMGGQARGVAVIDGRESDAALQALHNAGVRGVRLNLSLGVSGGIGMLEPLAARIAPLGWHMQLLMAPDQLAGIGARLAKLPVQLVFDHMARLHPDQAFVHPAHALVLRLQREGRAWVKVSGGYIVSRHGQADDPALDTLARSYIDAAPDRVLWGSDWPHATASAGRQPMPDDALQLDRLAAWAGGTSTFEQILVRNPQALYGFACAAARESLETS